MVYQHRNMELLKKKEPCTYNTQIEFCAKQKVGLNRFLRLFCLVVLFFPPAMSKLQFSRGQAQFSV